MNSFRVRVRNFSQTSINHNAEVQEQRHHRILAPENFLDRVLRPPQLSPHDPSAIEDFPARVLELLQTLPLEQSRLPRVHHINRTPLPHSSTIDPHNRDRDLQRPIRTPRRIMTTLIP